MDELAEEWIEKARFLIKDAEENVGKGVYWFTCFEAHQSVEYYLKALHTLLTGLYPFTHDIVELLSSLKDLGLNPPEILFTYGDALTPHYTMSRYPGRKPIKYDEKLGLRCLEYAKKIIGWVEKEISRKK